MRKPSFWNPTCNSNSRERRPQLGTARDRALRLRIVLATAVGKTSQQISQELERCVPADLKCRGRFARNGLAGLRDRPRSARPRRNDDAFRQRVLSTLEQPPPPRQSTWNGPLVAVLLGVSAQAVWR
jgi:transposase